MLMVGAIVVSVSPVFAASDNGCDNPDNDYIQSDYALCSTHPYNIGVTKIPDSSGQAIMREVVAMKTELITQQMYQNYRALESMLNRLEKQLNKAALKAQLDVASGGSSSNKDNDDNNGGRYSAGTRETPLASANNCSQKTSNEEIISCLQSNIQIIRNEVNSGNTTNARRQLENDLNIAVMNGFVGKQTTVPDNSKEDEKPKAKGYYAIKVTEYRNCGTSDGDVMTNCNNINSQKKTQTYLNCLSEFQTALARASELERCKNNIMSGGGWGRNY